MIYMRTFELFGIMSGDGAMSRLSGIECLSFPFVMSVLQNRVPVFL